MGTSKSLLKFGENKEGIQEVELNIQELYPDPKEQRKFKQRLKEFLNSDPDNNKVIDKTFLDYGLLKYQTECIIPRKKNLRRIPLLLLLGNPASHSVHSKMFFSYERDGKEHRFWKALKEANILSFRTSSNRERKKELYNLSYDSPFRIALATFYSMPSGASDKWGGIKGLYRLFGKRALDEIGKLEKHRVENLIRNFLWPKGTIFAFQKEAYLGVKNPASPDYCRESTIKGELLGFCECNAEVKLFCLPPTRNILGERALQVLCNFKDRVLKAP